MKVNQRRWVIWSGTCNRQETRDAEVAFQVINDGWLRADMIIVNSLFVSFTFFGKNVNNIGLVLIRTFEIGFEIQFSTWLFYSIRTVIYSGADVVAHIL